MERTEMTTATAGSEHSGSDVELTPNNPWFPVDDSLRRGRSNLSDEDIRKEIRSAKINLARIVFGNFMVICPANAITNSITSLLNVGNLGITSLAITGGMQLVTAATLASYIIQVCGIRKIVSVAFLLVLLFVLPFFYPTPVFILFSGAVMGVAIVMLSSLFMYCDMVGFWYTHLTGGNEDRVLTVVNGMIYSASGAGYLVGNILSYCILESGATSNTNDTITLSNSCGAHYCNEDLNNLSTMQAPAPWRYYTLVGVFTTMVLCGLVTSLFLRDYAPDLGYALRKKSEYCSVTKKTWLTIKEPKGYLLIPLAVFLGFEQSFVVADYTLAYVSCTIGISKVGRVMCAYGAGGCLAAASQWVISRFLGRTLALSLAVALFLSCFITLLFWAPNPDHTGVMVAIAFMWGAADSILVSMLFSAYALLFEDNIQGSISVGNFWWTFGAMLAFGWSQFLCISTKLYILIVSGCIGLVSYLFLEYLMRRHHVIRRSNF